MDVYVGGRSWTTKITMKKNRNVLVSGPSPCSASFSEESGALDCIGPHVSICMSMSDP